MEENGLKPEQCRFEEDALRTIIEEYTHEAGVRDLERRIGAVCRSVAAEVARGEDGDGDVVTITPDFARGILGAGDRTVREEHLKIERARRRHRAGLHARRAAKSSSSKRRNIPARAGSMLTGQIGNVMKESMQAALSLVRSRAESLGIQPEAFTENDLHVHVPSGAIPKDGPSAGCAMFTALASLFADRKVRSDVAMTGEITLRGLVLPIGGLKEKSLAALRAGIVGGHRAEDERKRPRRRARRGEGKAEIHAGRNGGRRAGRGARKEAGKSKTRVRVSYCSASRASSQSRSVGAVDVTQHEAAHSPPPLRASRRGGVPRAGR